LSQRSFRRLQGHIGRSCFGARNMPLAYACPLDNPAIVGFNHPGQVIIGQNAWRHITTQRRYLCTRQIRSSSAESLSS
jgi:hypothetical protein